MRHIILFYYATEDGHIYSSKSRRLITERLNNKELYSQGLSQYKIAEMYNVTRGTIQQILNGHTYSYMN